MQGAVPVGIVYTAQDAGLRSLTAVARALSSPLQPSPGGKGQLQELIAMVMKGV